MSSEPGIATRQDDDVVRSSTIGKVTQATPGLGQRLVPCVLYSGQVEEKTNGQFPDRDHDPNNTLDALRDGIDAGAAGGTVKIYPARSRSMPTRP